MPEFASFHDDGVFYVSAKSLATGNGYRIESLAENAYQTKYPPLYPLYLSIIWRLNPNFPENLRLATLASWLVLVACLVVVFRLYGSDGFSERRRWMLMGLLALNPYVILFGTRLFSEIPFICLLLAALLLARRQGAGTIIAAGLVSACAYLTRTAGIALLVSVPAWLLWKRDRRRALLFAVTMLPAVAGWFVWTTTHHSASHDLTLTYYTDYLGFQLANVGFDNLGVVLWKNFDQTLYGMGSLVIPKVIQTLPFKILTQVIGVAMVAGVVRLVRRGVLVDYALFAAASTAILLVWHYPANERFVLPLFPLLAAGLLAEGEHLWAMLRSAFRHKDASQRVAGFVFGAIVAAICLFAAGLQMYMTFFYLKDAADNKRMELAARRDAYQWISTNLPLTASVLSYDDPLLYLYTGRRGNYLPLMLRWWYADDHQSMIDAYRNVALYCRSRGLTHVLATNDDLSREANDEDRQAIGGIIRSDPALAPVFTNGSDTVYQVMARPTVTP